MTAKNANLLLDDSAAPAANGLQLASAQNWYGGPFSCMLTGTADGAAISLYICTKLPLAGKTVNDINNNDWVKLTDLTLGAVYNLANLNPCLVVASVASKGTNTRLRVLMQPF